MSTRVLILGGTADAVVLAGLLSAEEGFDVTVSLAGRTRSPAATAGTRRVGGFGGVDGLSGYLRAESIEALVDATHPYASTMSAHAAMACTECAVERLQLWRAPWQPQAADRWVEVVTMEQAAIEIEQRFTGEGAVFLTTGVQQLDVFRRLRNIPFVLRCIEDPGKSLPLRTCDVLLARGPFSESEELELFRRCKFSLLVSKNSGGSSTYAKIVAARVLGLQVIMLSRPERQPGPCVETPEDALSWLQQRY